MGNDHWRPDSVVTKRALATAQEIADASSAQDDLSAYYTVESNYAGATFANLAENDPWRITATDLLAVTTLSVTIPPMAVRRFMSTGEVDRRLAALPTDADIRSAEELAEDMASFYDLVKTNLRRAGANTSNAWVTASKICARKRPMLFPVRDSVVVDVLGLKGSYPDDWPIFSALMSDPKLVETVDRLVRSIAYDDAIDVGDPTLTLKHLDVLIWMHGVRMKKTAPAR